MSFGGGAPPPPQPQPVTPVPQPDDPKGLEEQRKVAARAKTREGYGSHMLGAPAAQDPLSGPLEPGRGTARLLE